MTKGHGAVQIHALFQQRPSHFVGLSSRVLAAEPRVTACAYPHVNELPVGYMLPRSSDKRLSPFPPVVSVLPLLPVQPVPPVLPLQPLAPVLPLPSFKPV